MTYERKEDVEEDRERLRDALGRIFDECQKKNPDVNFIEDEAAEALELEEEET